MWFFATVVGAGSRGFFAAQSGLELKPWLCSINLAEIYKDAPERLVGQMQAGPRHHIEDMFIHYVPRPSMCAKKNVINDFNKRNKTSFQTNNVISQGLYAPPFFFSAIVPQDSAIIPSFSVIASGWLRCVNLWNGQLQEKHIYLVVRKELFSCEVTFFTQFGALYILELDQSHPPRDKWQWDVIVG